MTVSIMPLPRIQFEDANGNPLSGGLLFTYLAGTTTKQATYTTSTGGTANSNPIVLNSSGYSPFGIWLTDAIDYKFVLAPATDSDPPTSPIWTEDNVSGVNDVTGLVIKATQAEVNTGTNDVKFVTPLTLATRLTTIAVTSIKAILTNAWDAATGAGQIYLNGATGNRIDFNANGNAVPAFTTRSAGTRIVLNPTLSASDVDVAIGHEGNSLWLSTPSTGTGVHFFTDTTLTGSINSSGFNGTTAQCSGTGVGYIDASGAGGTVTQATDKSTAVTLDKLSGTITMNNAALAAGASVEFAVNNAFCSSSDSIILNLTSGTLNRGYQINANPGSGAFNVFVKNDTAGSLSEALLIKFTIIKGADS